MIFQKLLVKPCLYKESLECNPPFLITNTVNEDLLIKTDIYKMILNFHSSYEKKMEQFFEDFLKNGYCH